MLDNLVSLQGHLVEAFSQLDLATIQHADEMAVERGTNEELRNQWLWTADGVIYATAHDYRLQVSSREPTLYLTRGKDNPIFKNIRESTRQLAYNHNYFLKKGDQDLEAAINSEDTLKAKLTDLNLKNYNDKWWSYFEFDTGNYKEESNKIQITVIERVFGEEGVKVLRDNGIKKARIYTLTPNYVKKHTGKDSAIARAGVLSGFDGDSSFGANSWGVDCSGGRLRGVLKKEDESQTDYDRALKAVLNNPQELDEDKALQLMKLTASFYKTHQ